MPIKYGANGLHDGTDETKELAFDVTGVTTGTTRTVTVPNANVDLPEINLTTTSNIGLGTGAVDAITTGNYNVGLGDNALTNNTTGYNNTASGIWALYSNTTGTYNTASGYAALYSNTTGYNNTASGIGALYLNTTGTYNTASGYAALYLNTTGYSNTASGYLALYSNTTGTQNVAVGSYASDAATTANYNVSIGSYALSAATTGHSNTVVGNSAGGGITTGVSNTCIGYNFGGSGSGQAITTGSRNTILGPYSGNQGGLDIRTSSNNIVLSDGDGNPRFIVDSNGRAQLGGTTGSYTAQLTVKNTVSYTLSSERTGTGSEGHVVFSNGNGAVGSIFTNGTSTAYNTSSDYRLKENITDITDGIDRLKQLSVHKFNFISDPDTTIDGFLAHEAQAVVPEAVTGTKDEVDDEGNPVYQGIDQSKLVPLLTAALKEAITEIESLKARVETLENA